MDEGEASWLRDGGLAILSAEQDLPMRPGRKLWIDDEISDIVDIQVRPLEKLVFSLGFNRNFATKDRVDNVS